jgi:RNA polymerase sigma-70 factor (ECF subfamily)
VAQSESTCWSVIQAAAAGSARDRAEFARRYGPVIRAYLMARWRSSQSQQQLDDAIQEVFVECFKAGGILERAAPGRGDFRAFLFVAVRNVALRLERARARQREQPPGTLNLEDIADDDPGPASAFERAWAAALFREAGRLQKERARTAGEAALRRVDLLRLRFQERLPIREIAKRWGMDAAVLHHEFARARQEFKAALIEVIAFHRPDAAVDLEAACADLLASLRK